MSYRLINSNTIEYDNNGCVSQDVIEMMPCIFVDLPNGMDDGNCYDVIEKGTIEKMKKDVEKFCKKIPSEIPHSYSREEAENYVVNGINEIIDRYMGGLRWQMK